MNLIAWTALLLFLVLALYAVWQAVREPTQKPQPKHRAGRRLLWGDRLTVNAHADDLDDWPPAWATEKPVTDEERAAAREFLAAMDDGEVRE